MNYPCLEIGTLLANYTENGIFYEFIKDIYYLSQKDCIFTGAGTNGVFADNPLKFIMVALRIVF